MKIRILHIIDQYRIGGPGKTILNSARFMDRNLYEIHVASFLPNNNVNTEISFKIISEKIPFLCLRDSRGMSIENLLKIRAYLRRYKISIFHCHGYKSEFYGYLAKLLGWAPIFVVTYHGWITNNLKQRVINIITRRLSLVFDGIITVADYILKKLPKTTRTRKVCHVIHNAIVLGDYQRINCREAIRKKYGIMNNELVYGVIGRISPEKGCFEAIDALARLRARSFAIKLMIIGDGPLKEEIGQYAKKKGVYQEVIFTGHVNPVNEIYQALDLVVSPSYTEGISNVILEAMALRKPVVATSVGGTPEIISHKHNGLLVPPRDAVALSDAIEIIVKDPNLGQRLTETAYVILREDFEFSQRVKKVEKFYVSVMTTKAKCIKRS